MYSSPWTTSAAVLRNRRYRLRPCQRYTEGPPAFRAASLAPPDSVRTWAFPWILSSAVSAFLDSLADGLLEQPPNAASVSTRKQKMRALRFIRHALAFGTFSSESEGITGHDRLQRTRRPFVPESSSRKRLSHHRHGFFTAADAPFQLRILHRRQHPGKSRPRLVSLGDQVRAGHQRRRFQLLFRQLFQLALH